MEKATEQKKCLMGQLEMTCNKIVSPALQIVSRLHIQNASVSVMYKCSAENKVGRDERLVYFYVTSESDASTVSHLPATEITKPFRGHH